MQDQNNKKEQISIKDRLSQFIEERELEQSALKKMIQKLEEDFARKKDDNTNSNKQ